MSSSSDILHGKILIVDDKKSNVQLLERMLRAAGYVSIDSTTDPSQVCELYRQNGYDLIMLDIMMADMDGLDALGERASRFVAGLLHEGADPGVCVCHFAPPSPALIDFGRRARDTVLAKEEALVLCAREGAFVRELGGTGLGVIGAVAACGLRQSRDDGRFISLPGARELDGVLSAGEIANRLGLNNLYRELQELAFRHLHPLRHRVLVKAVRQARGNRREVVGKILEAIRHRLPECGIMAEVIGREKHLYGIYRKMREKHLSFSQVLDIYGFRIIVKDIPTCYLALGALALGRPLSWDIDDLALHGPTRTLVAFTHGRSAYRVALPSAAASAMNFLREQPSPSSMSGVIRRILSIGPVSSAVSGAGSARAAGIAVGAGCGSARTVDTACVRSTGRSSGHERPRANPGASLRDTARTAGTTH